MQSEKKYKKSTPIAFINFRVKSAWCLLSLLYKLVRGASQQDVSSWNCRLL